MHADGSIGTLVPGATVYAVDAIKTGENSIISIGFLDGSGMNVGPESTATLGKDVIDPALIQEDHGSSQAVLDASGRVIAPGSGHDTESIGEIIGTVETTGGTGADTFQ